MNKIYLPRLVFYPLAILWMECVVKYWCFGHLGDRGLGYTLLFSIPAGLFCALFCSLGEWRLNRRIATILMSLLAAWYMIQTVYYTVFKTFLVLDTLTMAGDALGDFWREALAGIAAASPALFLLLIPVIAVRLCTWHPGKHGRREPPSSRGSLFFGRGSRIFTANLYAAAAVFQLIAVLAVTGSTAGVMSPNVIYRETLVPELSVSNFGVLTTLRLDAGQIADRREALEEQPGPAEPAAVQTMADPAPLPTRTPTPTVLPTLQPEGPNVLPIDFAALAGEEGRGQTLADMDRWFAQREPTMKNRYTGLFEGKNLIFITAEGFWKHAVNETYTPTLWRLAHEGFVFENFYNPLWWKSTTDGEYVACTSLIPSGAVRSFKMSGQNVMPFCMGNMLRATGYPTTAYHNHTWTYYNRDVSHPNMGYDYYGLGHGLDVAATWPESDLEMMEKSIPQALAGERPFHNYYMTVSGHMNYNFSGNAMAAKHREAVAGLNMSEEARAYLACNMELDQALDYVLEELEQAGELENTVICLSGDHYPYGMKPATWDEFCGGSMDRDFEIYRSTLILWSGDMEEPVIIEKPCSSLDILPTLLNLFGLEYDSRLLMGRDILSDSPGLAVFSNRSFITELGRYNARNDTWIPAEGAAVSEQYVLEVSREVRDMFDYSVKILDNDYYGTLGLTALTE